MSNVSNKEENKTDMLGMSDEDFMKLGSPEDSQTSSESNADDNGAANGGSDTPAADSDPAGNTEHPEGEKKEEPADTGPEKKDEPVKETPEPTPVGSDPSGKPDPKAKKEELKNEVKPEDTKKEEAAKPVDYKAFFDQVMKPFKANGRDITLNSPEEVIRLMQMGAGYGRKMQDLQPHLKTIRMLEKNNLLNEDRLSFLIDLSQKNPEAIKKLIKESGIDPLDINPDDNKEYIPRNHSVSDSEVAFKSTVDALKSHPEGQATIREINQNWDDESKDVLWETPQLMDLIHQHRENKIYSLITDEMNRQKVLGLIPQNAPFLKTYQQIGDALAASGKLAGEKAAPASSEPPAQRKVLETRTSAPPKADTSSERARAASPTQSAPRKAQVAVNPLNMADDEFMKTFSGRL